jgi:hypothetical protein
MVKDINLIGESLISASVKKTGPLTKETMIKPDIQIKSLNKEKVPSLKTDVLKLDYEFKVDYSGTGKVFLKGSLIFNAEPKKLKEIIKSWESKKLDEEFQVYVINLIIRKCSIKALQLEDQVGLIPHIQLPRAQIKKD